MANNSNNKTTKTNWFERMRKNVRVPGESKECSSIVGADLSMFIKSFENTHPFDPEVPLQGNPLWMCHQYNWESRSFFVCHTKQLAGFFFPRPRIKSSPPTPHWKHRVLTTGPPGKSEVYLFLWEDVYNRKLSGEKTNTGHETT